MEGLDACEGMWAFAAFDSAAGTLRLARDRFGEKPLYLLRDGDELWFGSELKFLAALAGRTLPVTGASSSATWSTATSRSTSRARRSSRASRSCPPAPGGGSPPTAK